MVSNGLPITALFDIGGNISANTVFPVVDLPANTSNKANLGEISNYILNSNLDANLGNVGVAGNITLTNGTVLEDSAAPAAFKITTDTGVGVIINSGNTQSWTFDIYGNITFPDTTVQNSAWQGTIAAANVTGLGNIATANFDGNAANVLSGTGLFIPMTVATGNIANTNLDGNASNILYGNGVFSYIQGDGGNLSNISGAGVSGEVSYAAVANSVAGGNVSGEVSYAAVANSVDGANVSGEVGYAATANSVDVANVSGIGNIATVNLDGNASNILFGNGVFSTAPGSGNITAINLDGNGSNVLLGNGVFSSVHGDGGNLSNITGSNVSGEVSYAATANSVAVGNVSGIGNIATINTDGNASNVLYGNGVFAAGGGGGGGGASISNGTSNVNIATSGGNVTTSVAGNVNVLTVTGTGANIAGTANVSGNISTASFFLGDGGLISNITVAGGTAIVNGNSNVSVAANGNVTVGVTGNANVMTIDSANVTIGANGYMKFIGSPLTDNFITIGGKQSYAAEVTIGNSLNTATNETYTSMTSSGFYSQIADGLGNEYYTSLDSRSLTFIPNTGIFTGGYCQFTNFPYPQMTLEGQNGYFNISTSYPAKSASILYLQDNTTYAYFAVGPYTLDFYDDTANNGISVNLMSGLSVVMYAVDGNVAFDISNTDSNLAGTFTANTVKSNIAFQMPIYASDAARDTAIPSPAQGMMVFNQTGNVFQGYTGTTWANLN